MYFVHVIWEKMKWEVKIPGFVLELLNDSMDIPFPAEASEFVWDHSSFRTIEQAGRVRNMSLKALRFVRQQELVGLKSQRDGSSKR